MWKFQEFFLSRFTWNLLENFAILQKWSKWHFLTFWNQPKLISRKSWLAQKSLDFHTVGTLILTRLFFRKKYIFAGEGLDDLEYDNEPGIALHELEFGRSSISENPEDIIDQYAPLQHRARCSQCGVDYESGKIKFFLLISRNSDTWQALILHEFEIFIKFSAIVEMRFVLNFY